MSFIASWLYAWAGELAYKLSRKSDLAGDLYQVFMARSVQAQGLNDGDWWPWQYEGGGA